MLSNPFMSAITHKHGKTQFLILLGHFGLITANIKKKTRRNSFKSKTNKTWAISKVANPHGLTV